ncbi:acyl-CoA/acyl-ACP dehydrogenase [Geodermatophilus sp. YIM 151500]|uniref:acyl-CoA dehydrogenase family protein n=1 Tax=Geodermatophilus sp. YIM 151500 TaxID=2984531 RepID=UPI0021E386BD|nr:acyl-CoA dehydrogenase family protein [Geodermatophilus sp. YIM 151500]MCV2488327.1 acyl-CoA/acyl-ACP dehydrogenase [Geodermatophilus sp. YIM 151500]
MASDQDLVVETVRDILAGHEPFVLSPERPWDDGLWRDLAEAGLTGVGLPEEAGGSGGEPADAVAVVRTLAAGAAAVPVAEQILVAGPALLAAGLDLPSPEEPLSVAAAGAVTAERSDGGWSLTGTATDIPWSGVAAHLAVLAAGPSGPVLARVAADGLDASDARNLAGEPRGSVVFDGTPADAAELTFEQAEELRARHALARAVQLSAAAEQVLAWTVQYAGERQQFGRPLGRFQAVQVELAQMAGEVTAAAALTDAAVQVLEHGGDLTIAAAAAKVRAGAAVEVVAGLGHQVHGAIGFTQEYRLHHLTRRLWSWRDEAGSELHWARVLGAGLVARSGDDLWGALTRAV